MRQRLYENSPIVSMLLLNHFLQPADERVLTASFKCRSHLKSSNCEKVPYVLSQLTVRQTKLSFPQREAIKGGHILRDKDTQLGNLRSVSYSFILVENSSLYLNVIYR